MTRSTASRRARNSASLTIGARRRPASRPSRRRCFLASSRVDPDDGGDLVLGVATLRTRVTVFCGSSPVPPSPSSPERRRRRRRREVPSVVLSSAASASGTRPWRRRSRRAVTVAVGGVRAVAGLAATASATAAAAAAAAGVVVRRSRPWSRRWSRRPGPSRRRRSRRSRLLGLVRLGRGCRLGGEWPWSGGGARAWSPSAAAPGRAGRRRSPSLGGLGCRPRATAERSGGRSWPAAFLRRPLGLRRAPRPRAPPSRPAPRRSGGLLGRGLLRGGLLGRRLLRRGLLGRGLLLGLVRPWVRGLDRCRQRRPRRREWASRRACECSSPPGAAYRPGPCLARPPADSGRPAQSLRSAATPSAVCVTGGLASPAAVAGPDLPKCDCHPHSTAASRSGDDRFPVCRSRSGSGGTRRERRRVDPAAEPGPAAVSIAQRRSGCGPFRRHPSGSPTSPVAGSSGSLAQPGEQRRGLRSQARHLARPLSTSSGRTAGTACRRVRSSSDQPGPASCGPTVSATTGSRQSKLRRPFLVIRSTGTASSGEERRHRGRDVLLGQRHDHAPSAGLEPVGQGARSGHDDLEHVEPVGQRVDQRAAYVVGVGGLGERDLEVLGLAGGPGRRGAGVGDPRVRVEARRVGHRDPRAEHRPLEGPAEVAVAGEAEPARAWRTGSAAAGRAAGSAHGAAARGHGSAQELPRPLV